MAKMSAMDAAMRILENEGVKHVFGIPGAGILPFYQSMKDSKTIEHLLCRHEEGAIHMADGYARAIGTVDLSRPVPDLWPQFVALGKVPAFVLRGEHSDVLSADTLEAMVERHPNLRTMTVPEQGHAPMLQEREPVEAIGGFFAVND